MYTNENDVLFVNASRISLTPTSRERPFQVMFLRKQHIQESKEPKDYDRNHLSLNVAVTLEQDHDLESQEKTFENDDQNATKITSALADTSICFFRPVTSTSAETLCACLFLMIIFLTMCHHPFLSQRCDHVVTQFD